MHGVKPPESVPGPRCADLVLCARAVRRGQQEHEDREVERDQKRADRAERDDYPGGDAEERAGQAPSSAAGTTATPSGRR
jgi:hypothetical protein